MSNTSETTANLKFPYIMPSQAQKHVTHNEALRMLDALVQPAVLDKDLTAPPADPAEGDRYIVAEGALAAWSGHDHDFAAFMDGSWHYFTPRAGWQSYVVDEGSLYAFGGSGWVKGATSIASELQNVSLFGLATTADATNPLSAKLDNVLFTARYAAESGSGDLRIKANKEAAAGTASFLFQTDWSGRAEFGLTGDDDFSLKVSPDGSAWSEAIKVDCQTGATSLRQVDSEQITVGYEQVGVTQPPSKGGILLILIVDPDFPQAPTASIFAYDVGSSPLLVSMFLGAAVENHGTTTLTGTTGTAGNISVAVDGSGNIHIENRFTGNTARQFSLTYLGGYRTS